MTHFVGCTDRPNVDSSSCDRKNIKTTFNAIHDLLYVYQLPKKGKHKVG